MFLQKNILNAISYVKPKLTGAGFSLFIFFTVFFIAADFDLYGVSKDLNNPFLWSIFYGYGIICSIFIDLLAVKIPKITGTIKIAFYVLAGYLIFLPFGWMMVIVGGTVGALCSLVFYFGTYMARKNVFFKYIFAICAPFILCIILNTDFTKKKIGANGKGIQAISHFSTISTENTPFRFMRKKVKRLRFPLKFKTITEADMVFMY